MSAAPTPIHAGRLRRRLATAFVLVGGVSAGSLAIGSYLVVRHSLLSDSTNRALTQAHVNLDLARSTLHGDASDLTQLLRLYASRPGFVTVAVLDGRHSTGTLPIPAGLRGLVARRDVAYQRETVAGTPYLVVGAPTTEHGTTLYFYFDEHVYLPIVRVYERLLPNAVKNRISDALDNIGEFTNLTNNLLQIKLTAAGITLTRVVINSTVGMAGLWDPATAMGLGRKPADFGQTLGHYGLGGGPYVMLPVIGPSNARDTTGLAVDMAAFSLVGPVAWVNETAVSAAYGGLAALDRRHRIPFRYHQTGSPFEYDLLRMLYTIKRDYDVAH